MKKTIAFIICALTAALSLVSCAVGTLDYSSFEFVNDAERIESLKKELLSYPVGADISSLVEQLKSEGCVIYDYESGITGYSRLCGFYEKTQRGMSDELKYALRIPKKVSPINEELLHISAIYYDGEIFTQMSRDIRVRKIDPINRFRYLKREKIERADFNGYAAKEHFYLVNDDSKSWDDIEKQMYSSVLSSSFDAIAGLKEPYFQWSSVVSLYYG